jgi:hypothetical protein
MLLEALHFLLLLKKDILRLSRSYLLLEMLTPTRLITLDRLH